ncbi:Hypothetical protein, putative [Bodo saltans]|uniref:Phosphatidylinositol-4-phosphate 5-kinase n=1 Tax=Bodo saltans TaxID=75058 RepID=A0A0S4JES9_BODSA|nr:Hypothetical protein, putative [Bodo saltans]|eukprot:CUG88627.1 Hypothetical protein, putative [Bodo saltans]
MDTRGAEQQCLQHFSIVPYDGPTQNERFHGFGSMTLTGQHEYAGMFKEGRRNGLGTMSWADGLKYVGPWVKNSATGQGALSWPNGTEYFGDVVKGKRHGNGVLFHGDNFYAGDWHCGKRHGFGLQVSPHVSYNGEWVDGSRHGWGVATFASGNVYCGCWENDAMHGYGSMTWVTDKSATTMDQVEAPNDAGGKELFIDAAAAMTANRDYIRKLRSRLTNVGTICPGPLGPYTPSCVAHASMYERYTGAFEGNLPHGVGQYESYFFDGDTRDIPFDTVNQYNGSFERGVRSGHGVQKYADGTMYSGQWSANMKHGQGSIIHPDGTSDEVRMELDAPQRHNSNRPTTGRSSLSVTSEQNAAVEDSLELDDLFLTKQDRAALKELLTRYKSSLKHLFICYSKLWSPDDLASKAQRMMQEDAKVPAPRWDHRVDSDIRDMVALGTAPQISNTELVLRMTRRAEQAARDAAERAMAVVAEATELHKVNAKERRADDDAGDSDNEHDDSTPS